MSCRGPNTPKAPRLGPGFRKIIWRIDANWALRFARVKGYLKVGHFGSALPKQKENTPNKGLSVNPKIAQFSFPDCKASEKGAKASGICCFDGISRRILAAWLSKSLHQRRRQKADLSHQKVAAKNGSLATPKTEASGMAGILAAYALHDCNKNRDAGRVGGSLPWLEMRSLPADAAVHVPAPRPQIKRVCWLNQPDKGQPNLKMNWPE